MSVMQCDGTTLTATLSDPDGGVMSVTWQWQRTSLTMFDVWEDISDAVSASYTPGAREIGRFLRVVASYTDGEGSGKSATSAATVAVAAATGSPTFADRVVSRSVDENSAGGVAVGEPVEANDADGDPLTYSLDGDDASSFTIDTDSGQIRVAAGADLNFETKPLYSVTVSVTDNKDSEGNADSTVDDTVAVTINVTNLDEAGSVTVKPPPVAGIASTAEVADPDGAVANVTSWAWEVAATRNAVTWTAAAAPTGASYVDVAAGSEHSCGLLDSGTILCWGDNSALQTDVPAPPGDSLYVGVDTPRFLRAGHTPAACSATGASSAGAATTSGAATPPRPRRATHTPHSPPAGGTPAACSTTDTSSAGAPPRRGQQTDRDPLRLPRDADPVHRRDIDAVSQPTEPSPTRSKRPPTRSSLLSPRSTWPTKGAPVPGRQSLV